MSAQAILDRLEAKDIRLLLRDGTLAVDAPRGAVDPALLTELRARKEELLALLQGRSPEGAEPPSKRFGLAAPRPANAPLVDQDWRPQHPHSRYVEPYKSALLAKLKLDRRYVRAQGMWMYDDQGRAVLDALSQYGALPLGHNPPEIWGALHACEASGEPAFAANSVQDASGALAERLVQLWPQAGFSNVVFTNSGAESLEVAIKLCRAATGRHDMLSLRGAFHGLTLGALTLAGSAVYRRPFASPDGALQLTAGDVQAVERALAAEPDRFAGLVVEPIQGEAGIVDIPDGYLAAVRALCDRYGVLLVLDEVQTGLGRTGHLFAAQREGVAPDVMALAKALGGGLLPIGACLYRPTARSQAFGLRHSSTFAGGALACRAGLALLARITADDGALVAAVGEKGRHLRARMEALQARFPRIVTRASGRGYMQGLRLDFSACRATDGLIGLLHDQNVLIHLVVSHLLHVGGVRLAPSFSAGDVLRIQPPLIAEREHLDRIADAIGNTLALVEAGDTLGLAGHILDLPAGAAPGPATAAPRPAPARPPAEPVRTSSDVGRFGFVVHPLEAADLARLDPAFAGHDPEALRAALGRFTDFIDPQPIETLEVVGRNGARAYGELILLPFTPADLIAMPRAKAIGEVELAVRLAKRRGARIVGLGGFSSIIAGGGLALSGEDLPALTSGNAFTAAATRQSLVAASQRAGLEIAASTAGVLGAGGMVARALAQLLAAEFANLVLVGNTARPRHEVRSRMVALDLVRSVLAAGGLLQPRRGSLADRLAQPDVPEDAGAALDLMAREGRLRFGGGMDSLILADAIGIAVSSLAQIVAPEHLKRGAVVCDASRPLAVDEAVALTRPDVTLLDAGVVSPPLGTVASQFAGPEPGLLFACAAETILWSLERAYDAVRPDACMEIGSIMHLERIARAHRFTVVGS